MTGSGSAMGFAPWIGPSALASRVAPPPVAPPPQRSEIISAAMEIAARADAKVAAALDGREVKRVITVPGRLVNFVV